MVYENFVPVTTYQGFKKRLVILKILGKYWSILNEWRIFSIHTFCFNFKSKSLKYNNTCNWTRTENQLVCKRTVLWARSSLTFSQLWSVNSLWNAYVTWQEHIQLITMRLIQMFNSSTSDIHLILGNTCH